MDSELSTVVVLYKQVLIVYYSDIAKTENDK